MARDKENYNHWFREYYKKHKKQYKEKAARVRAETQAKINAIKAAKGCLFCSEKEPVCLDFHHVNSEEKEQSVSFWAQSSSFKKALEEIQHCICVCSNCHRKIHAGLLKVNAP